jgi:hypothetical protein
VAKRLYVTRFSLDTKSRIALSFDKTSFCATSSVNPLTQARTRFPNSATKDSGHQLRIDFLEALIGIRGDDDDDRLDQRRIRPHPLDNAETIEPRHHQVEQNDRIVVLFQKFDRFGSIGGGIDVEPLAPHDRRDQLPDRLIVISDENSLRLPLFVWLRHRLFPSVALEKSMPSIDEPLVDADLRGEGLVDRAAPGHG